MLKYTQIHEEIHQKTGQSVTKKAVFQLINYWEKQITENIEQLPHILQEINKNREIQGLEPLKRINTKMINEAIKTYKQTDANHSSEQNGGTQQEKKKEKLASETHFSMEVI